ncbi:MAG: hypothetical protein NC115_10970 [Bacteroidales bacterium]|nr:hypothetical protein [Bacteroidales bacterium]
MTTGLRIATLFILLLTAVGTAYCQDEQSRVCNDIDGRALLKSYLVNGLESYDYFTESGDTLYSLPDVGEYIECVSGADSLKDAFSLIYSDCCNKYNEAWHGLTIYVHVLFDADMTIHEVRCHALFDVQDDNMFIRELCRRLTDETRRSEWRKCLNFPEDAGSRFHLLLTVSDGLASGQNKSTHVYCDVDGRPYLRCYKADGVSKFDYYTEKGDTLGSIPREIKYVEYINGLDSLRIEMANIYHDYIYRHFGNEYWTRILVNILFDKDLKILEVRTNVPVGGSYVQGLCHEIEDFVKNTQWVRKDGFNDAFEDHFFTVVYFMTNGHYGEKNVLPGT